MLKLLGVLLLLTMFGFGQNTGRVPPQPNYVPDQKTAERIAEAVLVAQFGQERVNAQLPLYTRSMSEDEWLVQGAIRDKQGRAQVGGAFGVWINKHTGCLKVMERMK